MIEMRAVVRGAAPWQWIARGEIDCIKQFTGGLQDQMRQTGYGRANQPDGVCADAWC